MNGIDVYKEDSDEFDKFLNKVVDSYAFGGSITQRDVIRMSNDLEYEETGIHNMFWIRQAFIAGRESTRPTRPELSDAEAFEKLKQLTKKYQIQQQ